MHTTGQSRRKNESNENAGVQPPGHSCDNITLCPSLVEIAPTLSEHDPLSLAPGMEGPEPAKHI